MPGSELFDKEVNAQKESLKKLPMFTQAPTSPQKSVWWKRKKQSMHVKMLLMEESAL